MNNSKSSFFTQLGILTKRLLLRLARRPLAELPNLFISAFFLLVYDGALGGVFGGNAAGTPFDFANGNFLNFILPVSIVSASVSGGASGIYLVEDIESGVFKRYQGMPISKWAIILAPIVIGAVRVLLQAPLIMTLGSIIGADPATGILPFQSRKIAFNLGLKGQAFKNMSKFITNLYNAYVKSDASLFEINPVLKASDDKIIAVDSKVTIDENALFRHKDYESLRDLNEENPVEVEARENGLNYVDLDGNVGCMVNGAGLAMATMDLIKLAGGEPAKFLDVGGTADSSRVEKAFRLILQDSNVKAILVNIFGGIVRCDRVAEGIVSACQNLDNINIPIIVRLQGTNSAKAKEIIDSSGLNVQSATAFDEAATKVQAAIN